jgi:glycosyltransferase involved in cell wall biosynthesis
MVPEPAAPPRPVGLVVSAAPIRLRPPVRALIVTNMFPTRERPALGSFVSDQVQALRRTGRVELEVFAFEPGGYRAYAGAAAELAARRRRAAYDVVHAHFGLTSWPARVARAQAHLVTLHGTDLAHSRSRPVTLAGLRLVDLVGVASEPLSREVPRWASRGRLAVLPCGVDLHRFTSIDRTAARAQLGLDPAAPCLLFPADPSRPEKRYDRARAVAGNTTLLTLGDVEPAQVPLWVNAANAVVIPSEREGFGLAVLEALACDVPVLSTPVGIAPEALADLPGDLCAPFEAGAWRAALAPHLRASDPRVAGRARAERFSSDRMAARVLDAWEGLLAPKRRR